MRCVLIHGLGQTTESWNPVVSHLHRQDVCCPDLFPIPQNEPLTYPALYRTFAGYCSGLDNTVDLCGLSLGGVLALNYAIDHPEKVHSLVLAAAQYKMPKGLLRIQNVLFSVMPEKAFSQTGLRKKDMIALCASMMELDFGTSLSEIHCPTLIVCGQRDSANQKASRELAGQIPRAQMKIIPGAGHEINTDTPEEFAKLLYAFYEAC